MKRILIIPVLVSTVFAQNDNSIKRFKIITPGVQQMGAQEDLPLITRAEIKQEQTQAIRNAAAGVLCATTLLTITHHLSGCCMPTVAGCGSISCLMCGVAHTVRAMNRNIILARPDNRCMIREYHSKRQVESCGLLSFCPGFNW